MQPLVGLVRVSPELVTAYNAAGQQRTARGRGLADADVKTVGEDRSSKAGRWLMVPGAADALLLLHRAWIQDGASAFRLTDMLRSGLRRQKLRQGYDLWVKAGKPARGRPGWRPQMHDAFVAPQNGSFHGAGCAVDFQSGLLNHPMHPPIGGDAALARLWDFMEPLGWTPVIGYPVAAQSESWHLDWMGPLRVVREAYQLHGYRPSYTRAAEVGTLLVGQWVGERIEQRTFQAVCALLHAHLYDPMDVAPDEQVTFVGRCDGLIGPKTRANEAWLHTLFKEAGIEVAPVWRDMLLACPELIDRSERVEAVFEQFNALPNAEQIARDLGVSTC